MGYYSRLSGEIRAIPPVPHAMTRNAAEDLLSFTTHPVRLRCTETKADTDDGIITRREGFEIAPYDDQTKAYALAADIQRIVNAFPGRRWDGYIEREGEESPDLERLYVRDGKVISVTPVITWPTVPDDGAH